MVLRRLGGDVCGFIYVPFVCRAGDVGCFYAWGHGVFDNVGILSRDFVVLLLLVAVMVRILYHYSVLVGL